MITRGPRKKKKMVVTNGFSSLFCLLCKLSFYHADTQMYSISEFIVAIQYKNVIKLSSTSSLVFKNGTAAESGGSKVE